MYPCQQHGTFPLHFSPGHKLSWVQTYGTITILLLLLQDLASTPTTHEIRPAIPRLGLDKKSCCNRDNESSCCQDVRPGSQQVSTRANQVTTRASQVTTRAKQVTTRASQVTTRASQVTTRTNQVTTRASQVTTRASSTSQQVAAVKDRKHDHFPANNAVINMRKSDLNTQCWTTHEVYGRKDSVESAATQRQVYIPFDRGIKVKPEFGHRGEGWRHRGRRQVFHRPVFLQPQDAVQEVFINSKAFLDCRVRNLGQNTVSWIRQRDLQILSVGRHLFTTDKRLSLTYEPREQNYRLEIRQVRREDFGLYECQINTKPMQTIILHLTQKRIPIVPTHKTVKATRTTPEMNELGEAMDPPEMSGAKTDILGGPDLYVHPNSLVNITCVVLASSKPKHIFWSHEGQGLTYHSRAGVSIVIEDAGQTIVSQLLIRSVAPRDQGTYQCKPDNHLPAEARVFIIEDAVSDATRVNSASIFPPWPKLYTFLILVVSRSQISNG